MTTVNINIDQTDFAKYRKHVAGVLDQADLDTTPEFFERNYLRAQYEKWFDAGHTITDWLEIKDFVEINMDPQRAFISASFMFHDKRDAALFKLTFGGV